MNKAASDKVPEKAMSYNQIGCLKEDMGQYDEAIMYYNKALHIMDNTLLQNNLFIKHQEATLNNNLGSVYRKKADYRKSLAYYYNALTILKDILPPDHVDISWTNSNISAVYRDIGENEIALDFLQQALESRERVLPTYHKDVIDAHMQLGLMHYDQGNIEKTLEYTNYLIMMLPPLYQTIMSTASDSFRIQLLRKIKYHAHFIYTIAFKNPEYFNIKELYNLLMQIKDIDTESEYVIRTSDYAEQYPKYAETLVELSKKRMEQQNLILNEPRSKTISNEINQIQQDIYNLEISLAPYIREIDFKLHMSKVGTDAVLSKLPSGSALLEYGWFFYRKSAFDTEYAIESGGRYFALLLHNSNITLRYLGEDKYINDAIDTVRKGINLKRDRYGASIDEVKTELAELYGRLIYPFIERLDGVEHLYIAPEGKLYSLPFELLRDKEGNTLGKFYISYLSSGRDIIRVSEHSSVGYTRAAIIADPQFDLPDSVIPTSADNDAVDGTCGQKKNSWPALPNAKTEAEMFERVFHGDIDKWYGLKATKSSLRHINSPSIVHIITHGYYSDNQNFKDNAVEDPMMRCGLAFAGANHDYINGILTGKEVLSLDLQETDLLVLSACETALGEARNGEGIKGLRRAFELNGVHTLICTLWRVNDEASAVLMWKFYSNLLEEGMDKLLALSNAKEYVRNITARKLYEDCKENGFEELAQQIAKMGEDVADKKIYAHPYYWAGYILQGNTAQKSLR